MDIVDLFDFAPLLFILGILICMYFIMVRKSEFEERLALYRRKHQVQGKRAAYLNEVRKFCRWVMGIIIVVFVAPSLIIFVLILRETGIRTALNVVVFNGKDWTSVGIYLIVFLVYWLLRYVLKRNEKALQMLVEQMSDSDFDLLLKVKDSVSLDSKYSPPFVLCNHRLYLFSSFGIREIDPTKITDINCNWGWGSNRKSVFVRIKLLKKTIGIVMLEKAFPYFQRVVEKYAKLKF